MNSTTTPWHHWTKAINSPLIISCLHRIGSYQLCNFIAQPSKLKWDLRNTANVRIVFFFGKYARTRNYNKQFEAQSKISREKKTTLEGEMHRVPVPSSGAHVWAKKMRFSTQPRPIAGAIFSSHYLTKILVVKQWIAYFTIRLLAFHMVKYRLVSGKSCYHKVLAT